MAVAGYGDGKPHLVRASYMQSLVAELANGPRGAEVMVAIAPQAARIMSLVGVGLVAVDDVNTILGIVGQQFGQDIVVDASRRQMAGMRESPLMRSVFQAVVRLSGLTPHAIFKVAPRARDAIVSGAGSLNVMQLGDRQLRLELRGFPPAAVHVNIPHFRGLWLGVLDVCNVVGTVTAAVVDDEHGDVDFTVGWS